MNRFLLVIALGMILHGCGGEAHKGVVIQNGSFESEEVKSAVAKLTGPELELLSQYVDTVFVDSRLGVDPAEGVTIGEAINQQREINKTVPEEVRIHKNNFVAFNRLASWSVIEAREDNDFPSSGSKPLKLTMSIFNSSHEKSISSFEGVLEIRIFGIQTPDRVFTGPLEFSDPIGPGQSRVVDVSLIFMGSVGMKIKQGGDSTGSIVMSDGTIIYSDGSISSFSM